MSIIAPIVNLEWINTARKPNRLPNGLKIKSAKYTETRSEQSKATVVIQDLDGSYKDSPLFVAGVLWFLTMGSNEGSRRVIRGTSGNPSKNFGEFPEYTLTLYEVSSEIMNRQRYQLSYDSMTDSDLIRKINAEGKYGLVLDIDETNVKYSRNQKMETDFEFMQRLANEQTTPFIFKVENSVLIFKHPKNIYNKKPYLLEWNKGRRSVKSYSIDSNLSAEKGLMLSSHIDPFTGKRTVFEVIENEVTKTLGSVALTKLTIDQYKDMPFKDVSADDEPIKLGLPYKEGTVVKTPSHSKEHTEQTAKNEKANDDDKAFTITTKLTNGNIWIRTEDRVVVDGCGDIQKNFCFIVKKVEQEVNDTQGFSTSLDLSFYVYDEGIYNEALDALNAIEKALMDKLYLAEQKYNEKLERERKQKEEEERKEKGLRQKKYLNKNYFIEAETQINRVEIRKVEKELNKKYGYFRGDRRDKDPNVSSHFSDWLRARTGTDFNRGGY